MVFFVLSGFLVGGSVLSQGQEFRFEKYFVARLSRLWIVLVPALFFTVLIDFFINQVAPDVILGQHYSILKSGPSADGNYSDSLSTFILNILFLQTILVPVFGTNGPLWSLANEFWYYLMFPLFYFSFNPSRSWKVRLLLFSIFLLSFYWVGQKLMEGFLIWLLGVAAFRICMARFRFFKMKLPALLSLLLFLASLVASKLNLSERWLDISSDFAIGISFSLLICFLFGMSMNEVLQKPSRWLSDVSYTLYLFHFPLVVAIYSIFYHAGQMVPDLAGFSIFIFWLMLLTAAGWIFWYLFERNTWMLRGILERVVFRKEGSISP